MRKESDRIYERARRKKDTDATRTIDAWRCPGCGNMIKRPTCLECEYEHRKKN